MFDLICLRGALLRAPIKKEILLIVVIELLQQYIAYICMFMPTGVVEGSVYLTLF